MNDLSKLYGEQYVKKIVKKDWRTKATIRNVQMLYDHFKPTSIIDIGAANGLHTHNWRKLGCFTCGIEGTPHFEEYLKKNSDVYRIQDIRKPFDIGKEFDLATSVEVLEHIEAKHLDMAVENIIRHGKVLFITASPSKGGHSHVNPQPKQYWIDVFESKGVKYQEEETKLFADRIREQGLTTVYSENSMIFRKDEI